MEYIHKEKQTIITDAFYNALKPAEKKNYRPYFGEDADDGTKATNDIDDIDEDDDLEFDMFAGDSEVEEDEDEDEDDDDVDFGGGSGGGGGASDDF